MAVNLHPCGGGGGYPASLPGTAPQGFRTAIAAPQNGIKSLASELNPHKARGPGAGGEDCAQAGVLPPAARKLRPPAACGRIFGQPASRGVQAGQRGTGHLPVQRTKRHRQLLALDAISADRRGLDVLGGRPPRRAELVDLLRRVLAVRSAGVGCASAVSAQAGLRAVLTGWKNCVSRGMCHLTSCRPAAEASSVSAARVLAR